MLESTVAAEATDDGVLTRLRNTLIRHGDIRISITTDDESGEYAWIVDRRARTVYLAPGLSNPDMMTAIAEGLEALTPPVPAPEYVGLPALTLVHGGVQ